MAAWSPAIPPQAAARQKRDLALAGRASAVGAGGFAEGRLGQAATGNAGTASEAGAARTTGPPAEAGAARPGRRVLGDRHGRIAGGSAQLGGSAVGSAAGRDQTGGAGLDEGCTVEGFAVRTHGRRDHRAYRLSQDRRNRDGRRSRGRQGRRAGSRPCRSRACLGRRDHPGHQKAEAGRRSAGPACRPSRQPEICFCSLATTWAVVRPGNLFFSPGFGSPVA